MDITEALKFIAFTSLGFAVGWWRCRRTILPRVTKELTQAFKMNDALREALRKQLEE